jgi:hypothetical protein
MLHSRMPVLNINMSTLLQFVNNKKRIVQQNCILRIGFKLFS